MCKAPERMGKNGKERDMHVTEHEKDYEPTELREDLL